MQRESIGWKVALMFAVMIGMTAHPGAAADMEISDDGPSDVGRPDMEISDDGPAEFERPDMEISDDGPAEFERDDMDQYETWREELDD
jgi:hypothetical protein